MNISQFRKFIVRPTLHYIDLYSPAAENILIGSATHESAGLEYISQITNGSMNDLGPGIGPYQIEHDTHVDQFDNYLNFPGNKKLLDRVLMLRGGWPDEDHQLATNFTYATAIARVKYYRDAEPLPDAGDLNGLAWYWKRVFNTMAGAGTVEKFIADYRHYSANDGALIYAE